MALKTKTVQYCWPTLTTLADNTATTFTQITIHIPEHSVSTPVTFEAVWVDFTFDENAGNSLGNVATRTIELRLASTAYISTINNNAITSSGENMSIFTSRVFTDYFNTNWTGTSMTSDLRVTVDAVGAMSNATAILNITYTYDDANNIQLKSVWIPLNAPATSLPTTKTSHDTIPNLSTYLPEANKTFREIFIVTQANTNAGATSDFTVSYQISSIGSATVSGNYEQGANTDRWVRYVWDITSIITTNTTHTFNVWASQTGRMDAMQAWMIVTYEFDKTNTTSAMNWQFLPMEIDTPIGLSDTEFQRAERDIWLPEPNPSVVRIAAFVFWNNIENESGLNIRIGKGSFETYTITGSAFVAGSKGLMIRNDAPNGVGDGNGTFTRGRNKINLDLYSSSTTSKGGNWGAFWIINYTSDICFNGIGCHTRTIQYPIHTHDSIASNIFQITSSVAPTIADVNYFINGTGFMLNYINNGTLLHGSVALNAEVLESEGGPSWQTIYSDSGILDSEVGNNIVLAQSRTFFKRWTGDFSLDRVDIETPRRYILYLPNQNATATGAFWELLQMNVTYHSLIYAVAGTVTGALTLGAAFLYLNVHRYDTGEIILSDTFEVSDSISYSFNWFDRSELVYVVATAVNFIGAPLAKGISMVGIAQDDLFNIDLGAPTGGGESFF